MSLRRAGIGAVWACTACLGTPSVSDIGKTPVPDSGDTPSWVGELHATSAAPAAYLIAPLRRAGTVLRDRGHRRQQHGHRHLLRAAWRCELPDAAGAVDAGARHAGASAGQYAVLSAQGDPIYPNLAKPGSVVRLVLQSSGALQIYPVSGNVTITSGPANVGQELGGQHLTGSYHLGFAAEPLQGNCSFGTAVYDLGDQVISTDYVCACDTPEGKPVFACDGGGGNFDGCCYQNAPAAFTVDGAFDATPCPGLCVAPLGVTKACHPLSPDGGQ